MKSNLGRAIGSFGPYVIFKTPVGLIVRFETLASKPARAGRPARVIREYLDVNSEPVGTVEEANAIIGDALQPKAKVLQ